MTLRDSLETALRIGRSLLPHKVFRTLQPIYHWLLALVGTVAYGYPSRYIRVVAITGTKGKSTTAEIVNAILEEAGYKTALSSTIRQKIDTETKPNLYKMSTPGRFFLPRFLSQAASQGCQWAVIELTSEAAKQFRHRFLFLDALIFTNITPEHIESHGSFDKYLAAKLSIAKRLSTSPKRPRIVIANLDNPYGALFYEMDVDVRIGYHLSDAIPYETSEKGSAFTFMHMPMHTALPGRFNLENILSALHFATTQDIPLEIAKRALEKLSHIPGRTERVIAGQTFPVVVDYAHTADSLKALYGAYGAFEKICVLGSCGGGRDTWKRPLMGNVAETECSYVILTNEDPYDEDPNKIINDMVEGMKKPDSFEVIMDRRLAIKKALLLAKAKEQEGKKAAVIITGKGTDPYIMEANGKKTPWSDRKVAEEELKALL